ncbi:unnamed protein product, partial [Linum tenue]
NPHYGQYTTAVVPPYCNCRTILPSILFTTPPLSRDSARNRTPIPIPLSAILLSRPNPPFHLISGRTFTQMSFPFLLLSSLLTLLRLNPKLAGRSSNLHQGYSNYIRVAWTGSLSLLSARFF